jgi:hypothetical protein
VTVLHGWVRDWYLARTGEEVREVIVDAGASENARAAIPAMLLVSRTADGGLKTLAQRVAR